MKERIIPNNAVSGKRILGFHKRNLIEGIICALLFCLIVNKIPFVLLVKRIVSICMGLFLIIINGIGIKGQSLSFAFINYLSYKRNLKTFSYKPLEQPETDSEAVFTYEHGKKYFKKSKKESSKNKFFSVLNIN